MGSTHLFALKKKHESLEKRIHLEQASLSGDGILLRRLKEEKLHLKEQIYRIEESSA